MKQSSLRGLRQPNQKRSAQRDRDFHLQLFRAFEQTYLTLVRQGLIEFDAKVMRELWLDFNRDMGSGFASLFGPTRH